MPVLASSFLHGRASRSHANTGFSKRVKRRFYYAKLHFLAFQAEIRGFILGVQNGTIFGAVFGAFLEPGREREREGERHGERAFWWLKKSAILGVKNEQF